MEVVTVVVVVVVHKKTNLPLNSRAEYETNFVYLSSGTRENFSPLKSYDCSFIVEINEGNMHTYCHAKAGIKLTLVFDH